MSWLAASVSMAGRFGGPSLLLAIALAGLISSTGMRALPVTRHLPPQDMSVEADERVDRETLDRNLARVLATARFTGTIERTLERRLGRRIDVRLARLGRLPWFDTLPSLHHDNTCGGCHSPAHGFGDSQPIAIGIQNNGIVGPDRRGETATTVWRIGGSNFSDRWRASGRRQHRVRSRGRTTSRNHAALRVLVAERQVLLYVRPQRGLDLYVSNSARRAHAPAAGRRY
jgi:hypothetical protein